MASRPARRTSTSRGFGGTEEKVVAVGDGGRIDVFDVPTMNVTQVAAPTDEALAGVWGASLDDVWIVGQNELIAHAPLR